ncbi:MAG: 5-(carboxyamino)imidazole ribonucleotide synthase [Planctomycetota bacterium]
MKIGILGGGQLGRMLALAGYPLGFSFRFLEKENETPAGQVGEIQAGDYVDRKALDRFVVGLDVVTYEFENVPVEAARYLQDRVPVYPPPQALEVAQDRWVEKSRFRDLGIPTPRFAPVDSLADLQSAVQAMGLPAVLKTRRLGYDGKGQTVLRNPEDLEPSFKSLGSVPLILEEFIPFDREISILVTRGKDGKSSFYPLVENHHREGILRTSFAPAPSMTIALQRQAEKYGQALAASLDYVGVLALELFEVRGQLLANECAPRVHNSGHWTIEGSVTSQFENHLRAVAGFPLGSTDAIGHSAMWNILGTVPPLLPILEVPGAHLHLYGKEPRPGRKLGHVTICSPQPHEPKRIAGWLDNLQKSNASSTNGANRPNTSLEAKSPVTQE